MTDGHFRLGNMAQSIESEIEQGATQSAVAHTYALAMLDGDATDWVRANKAIIERWSMSGLERVKTMAWKLARTPERLTAPEV